MICFRSDAILVPISWVDSICSKSIYLSCKGGIGDASIYAATKAVISAYPV